MRRLIASVHCVWLRYNYRLYPTPGQVDALARAFGCARVVFNDGLALRRQAELDGLPWIDDSELQKRVVTRAKKTAERAWLGEVSAVVLVQALADLHQAFRNHRSGLRQGRRVGPPRYRSKKDRRQSIRFTRNAFVLRESGELFLAKVGNVEVRWSRPLPSTPSSVTVVKDCALRYFASFVVEVEPEPLPPCDSRIGIDLGLHRFAVCSDGKVIGNPRFLRRAEKRLRKAQRSYSRKVPGSRNGEKARLKLARAHVRIADARREFSHRTSTEIVRENQAIFVEDLNVRGLARARLAKSVRDAGWGAFLRRLEQKADRHGRVFGRVDRFFPSSQLCSGCGRRDGPKPLHVRTWVCSGCGVAHDRDWNASKNILAAGLADRRNACGGDGRPGSGQAVAREAGTPAGRPEALGVAGERPKASGRGRSK
jgi:putative transposase